VGQTGSNSAYQAQFLDPRGSLTSLTYFPFPFREHVQEWSQEHGKVSVAAFPHLIAIPPSINIFPRLPLRQHLLTFLWQEVSPACVAPSCLQDMGLRSLGQVKLHPNTSADLPGFSRARTSCRCFGSRVLWLFLGIN
jgi:hypothetical protein